MRRVSSIICVVFLLAPMPWRISAAQDVALAKAGSSGNQFNGWTYFMAICAATVLDKGGQLKQTTSTESLVEVRVTETFWGEQDLKALYVQKGDPPIQPGERILLAVRSDNYETRTVAVADTVENRNELRKTIESRARIRVERGFLDVPTLLDEGEDLLRSYVKGIAERLPNHPHLGKSVIEKIQVHRCKAPLGAYVRVMEDYSWKGRYQQMRPLPGKDGIVFWAAAAVEDFAVGHPVELGQSSFLGWAGDREVSWDEGKDVGEGSFELPPTAGPLALRAFAVYVDPGGNSELEKVVREEFYKLRERQDSINRNPPRNINAAIAQVEAHHREMQNRPGTQGGMQITASHGYGTSTLGYAYEALLSQHAKDHLSVEQKRFLVPLLIDLLIDRAEVENRTASDGPIILSHQRAYQLLKALTGSELPPPLSQKQDGGRRGILPGVTWTTENDPIREKDDANRRHMAWKNWWEIQKTKTSPDKPDARDGL